MTSIPPTQLPLQAEMEEPRSRRWVELALALGIGLGASVVLPLVLGEDIVVRQVARVYAPLAAWIQREGRRDEISVLLIDDKTLSHAGEAWPASYRYQSRLLDAVALYKPRGVFFDIVFSNARPDASLPALVETLCRVRAGGTKVYLAAQRGADGQFRLRPELEAIANRCFEKVAIEYQPDIVDQTAWTYRLSDGLGMINAPRSAALAIYENETRPLPQSAHRSDLALVWGLVPAAEGLAWSAAPGHGPPTVQGEAAVQMPYCRASMNAFIETLPTFMRKRFNANADKPVCVFHSTLYPADLVTSTDAQEGFLKGRLEGKFVMIGTALDGSNDRVHSPIHGRIPGVYLHATALGNLLDDGADYKQATHLGAPADWAHVKVWLMLLLGLLAVLAVGMVRKSRGGKAIVRRLRHGTAHRQPEKTRIDKLRSRTREAFGWVVWKIAVFTSSFALVLVLLLVGQTTLDVGFITVIDVAVFALAAEWFKWNAQLLAWLRDEQAAADE